MYGAIFRKSTYQIKYQWLAEWFLAHQGLFESTEADAEDLAQEIEVAIDNWMSKKDPRKADALP